MRNTAKTAVASDRLNGGFEGGRCRIFAKFFRFFNFTVKFPHLWFTVNRSTHYRLYALKDCFAYRKCRSCRHKNLFLAKNCRRCRRRHRADFVTAVGQMLRCGNPHPNPPPQAMEGVIHVIFRAEQTLRMQREARENDD